jgi:hypothetical protein
VSICGSFAWRSLWRFECLRLPWRSPWRFPYGALRHKRSPTPDRLPPPPPRCRSATVNGRTSSAIAISSLRILTTSSALIRVQRSMMSQACTRKYSTRSSRCSTYRRSHRNVCMAYRRPCCTMQRMTHRAAEARHSPLSRRSMAHPRMAHSSTVYPVLARRIFSGWRCSSRRHQRQVNSSSLTNDTHKISSPTRMPCLDHRC